MKQLVIALLIALTLSGCASDPNTDASAAPSAVSTRSFYLPSSPMELATDAAVRTYDMGEPITGIGAFGDDLLICTDRTKLLLLDPDTLTIDRQRDLESPISWSPNSLKIGKTQLGYFDAANNCYVILNQDLVAESSTSLPTQSGAKPAVSSDFKTIYYAAKDGIRSMDLSTGISRILRQESGFSVTLEGLLFDDQVLRYTRAHGDNSSQTCFISTQDGSIYYTATYNDPMIHWDNWYAAAPSLDYPFGTFQRIVTGTRDGSLQMLCPSRGWKKVISPGSSLVITQSPTPNGLELICYDLKTGIPEAQILLPQQSELFSGACTQGSDIWLWNNTSHAFYRWDTKKSVPKDQASILCDFASVTDPAVESVQHLIDQANSIAEQYGIEISFAEHENRTPGFDYTTVPDYRPQMYSKALELLSAALEKIPSGFLTQIGARVPDGVMQIRLLDDYDPVIGTAPGTGSCSFVDTGIILNVSMCPELENLFLQQLGIAIVTRITSLGNGLKIWPDLNPDNFRYGSDSSVSSPYLAEGKSYFTDAGAMQSMRDDQAHIFMYAMLPNQQKRFQSRHLQKKLEILCSQIRATYEISPDTELPWEQYLTS